MVVDALSKKMEHYNGDSTSRTEIDDLDQGTAWCRCSIVENLITSKEREGDCIPCRRQRTHPLLKKIMHAE